MLLVICHLSCDVIGYEGSKCDWCFLIHLLSQLDGHWLLVKLSFVSYQQQSYSGPNTPKRSYSTYSWKDSWVQTFHYTSYFYLARVNHVQSHGLYQFRAIISTCFLRVKINDSIECFLITYFLLDKLFHFILELKIFFSFKDVLMEKSK